MKKRLRFLTSCDAAIRTLSLEDGGRLLLAVLDYAMTGEAPALSGAAQAVFAMIAEILDRDKEISLKRAAAGALGAAKANAGIRQKTTAYGSKSQQNPMAGNAGEGREIKACDSLRVSETTDGEGDMIRQNAANGEHGDRKIDREKDINTYPIYPSIYQSPQAQPTVEEVAACCRERGYSVNAAEFVDYYAERNWMVGNEPMRDWKACLRAWERNEKRHECFAAVGSAKPAKTVAAQQYSQRDYSDEDEEAFQRMLVNTRKEGY